MITLGDDDSEPGFIYVDTANAGRFLKGTWWLALSRQPSLDLANEDLNSESGA
jgi:hypothetical protein